VKVTTKIPEPSEQLVTIELTMRDAAILHRLTGNIGEQHPCRTRMNELYHALDAVGACADKFDIPRLNMVVQFDTY
jgi:hypothetical protein